jgi:hypothetical protein
MTLSVHFPTIKMLPVLKIMKEMAMAAGIVVTPSS